MAYTGDLTVGVLSMSSDVLAMASVLLNKRQEPFNALLIVIMTLALDYDLLATIDELIAALFREVLLGENTLAVVVFVFRLILVLLRNPVEHTVLRTREFGEKSTRGSANIREYQPCALLSYASSLRYQARPDQPRYSRVR